MSSWPGVVRAERRDDGVQELYTADADALVRDLVRGDVDFHDLRIRGASLEEAAAQAAEGTSPVSDINAGAAYREHLARVLVARALTEAATRS